MNVPYYIIAIALFLAFLYVTGRVVWPWARPHPFSCVIAMAVGMGSWIVVSFLLCVVGGYLPTILRSLFWGVLVIALVWGSVRWQVVVAGIAAWWRDVRPLDLVLLMLMVVPALLLAVLPLLSLDANVYHLAVPNLYLRAGGFREIPYLVYSNWPLGMELLFGWALALQDFVLAKLIHCGCGVLLVCTLYQHCCRRGHPIAGLLAAALFLVTEIVRVEMAWAYVDVAQAWLFFLAFAVWEEALDADDPTHRRRGLCLAAVLLGVVAGLKLTGLVCAAIVVACHLVFGLRQTKGGARDASGKELVILLLIPLLLWLPWALRSWLLTGNPVYPLLHGLFGGDYLSGELLRQLREWHAGIGMGRGVLDYLLLPYRVVFEAGPGWGEFHGRLHIAWAAAIPLAVIGAILDPRCRRLLLVAVLFGVYWAVSSQQMRLLIPALPFLAAGAGIATVSLWRRWLPVSSPWPTLLVAVGCLGAGLGIWSTVDEARARLDAKWSFRPSLSSGLHVDDVLCLGRDPRAGRGLPDYLHYVNQELPRSARVIFLRTNSGFFCEREYLCDSFLEVSQMAAALQQRGSLSAMLAWLQEQRITHILLARDQVSGRNVTLPDYFTSALQAEQGFRRVFQGSDGEVYQVMQD
ncbi:MAG: hypothetical protein ACYTKC_01415 [Planctomycetota bacterium]